MPFQFVRGNILTTYCDAIVNPTDELMSGSSGLDAQIHLIGGADLYRECQRQKPLIPGDAFLTKAFNINCSFVIHTVATAWTGKKEQLDTLRLCYRNVFQTAVENCFSCIAFPLIGGGTGAFSKEMALEIALEEIHRFISSCEDDIDLLIYLVIHDTELLNPNPEYLSAIESTLSHFVHYKETSPYYWILKAQEIIQQQLPPKVYYQLVKIVMFLFETFPDDIKCVIKGEPTKRQRIRLNRSLPHASINKNEPIGSFEPNRGAILDESFSEMVLRKADEKGFKKDSDLYHKANIDRRVFSRLRCDKNYHPKKTTALALAVALELSYGEFEELIQKAGYALSPSLVSDLIVRYFVLRKNYNIYEINEMLFLYNQPLLGV